jgi:hypothetical protein
MTDIDPQEFGKIQALVITLERDVKAIKDDLRAIRDTLAEFRGGRRALWLLVGAAGSFGAAVTWSLQHISVK